MKVKAKPAKTFQAKPIIVEAWQWDGDVDWRKAPDWIQDLVHYWGRSFIYVATRPRTGELGLQVLPMYWVVRGVKTDDHPLGEITVFSPKAFAATYKAIKEA